MVILSYCSPSNNLHKTDSDNLMDDTQSLSTVAPNIRSALRFDTHAVCGGVVHKKHRSRIMITYVKITSNPDKDTIIKAEDGSKQYQYIFGADKWVRSGLLAEYWGDYFEDYYVKISEEEAIETLEKQKIQYKEMYEYILEKAKSHEIKERELFTYVSEKGGFQNRETDIVALIYGLGEEFYNKLERSEFPYRILNSVKVLLNNTDMGNEKHLMVLRKDSNAHNIAKFIIEKRYSSEMMSKSQYDVLRDYFEYKILIFNKKMLGAKGWFIHVLD